jgi:hypothetical protein
MLESKGLYFDLVVLNPDPTMVSATLDFKVEFFDEILKGSAIKEVVMYEDRKPHWHAFRKYFAEKKRLKHQVHLVKMEMIYLDRSVEEQLILGLMKRKPAAAPVSETVIDDEQVALAN